MSAYPKNLMPILKRKWESLKKRPGGPASTLPPKAELEILLDVAFHATFFTEEGRRPGFRIIYYSPQEYKLQKSRGDLDDSRLLRLDEARPYTASEVNRLAPAAELTRLLMCVTNVSKDPKSPELRMWGMLDEGENWWKYTHHETSGGKPPPDYLTITSSSPGELSLSVQGEVLVTLKSGQVFSPTDNALWSGPIADFLEDAQRQLHKDVLESLKVPVWNPEGDDEGYPRRFYNFLLERILFYVHKKQHGGTIIVIPSRTTKVDTRLTEWINIKYPCSYNYVWDIIIRSLVNHHKYYGLHFLLWDGRLKLTTSLFQQNALLARERQELEEALGDVAQAIAALTAVDGAVVMTDRFNVMGFGAEVIALSPSLREIVIVTKSTHRRAPIESYGTRHRAAFRFCFNFEDSIAFVVSSDGGVKAIKRVGSDVFLWPDINTDQLSI